MRKLSEMDVFVNDVDCRVRFDYQPQEREWFSPNLGVGHPGCDAKVTVTGLSFGAGWVSPEIFAPEEIARVEEEVLSQVLELEGELE
jgi:hypothetical protein